VNKIRNSKLKYVIIAVAGLITIGYLTGVLSQVFYAFNVWSEQSRFNDDGLAGMLLNSTTTDTRETSVFLENFSWMPIPVLFALFHYPFNLVGLVVVGVFIIVIIAFLTKNGRVKGVMDTERNLIYSNKGTYGTAGWMTEDEMLNEFQVVKSPKYALGNILGTLDGMIIAMHERLFESKTDNRNVAVYGAAGTMKSRAYVFNAIFQSVMRGDSLVITDPSSEIYRAMKNYLEAHGYTVKMFNLVNPEHSDPWNCLREIEGGNPELMAQQFCDVVIRNTMLGGKLDPFWDTGAISLLKALALYVVMVYPVESRSIGEVYYLLAGVASEGDGGNLKAKFAALPFGHAAKIPFEIFSQASDNVQTGIIIGLANRIQVFQIDVLRKITGHSEDGGIDLTLPGREV